METPCRSPKNRFICILTGLVLIAVFTAIGFLLGRNLPAPSAKPIPANPTTAKCGSCPQLSPPSPDFCQDGTIVSGAINECGCQSPPKCVRIPQDWKTYKNEKYGFEVMYPSNWQIKQEFSGQDGFFITNNQDESKVAILPNGEFDYGLHDIGLPGEENEISNITFSDREAKQILFKNSKIKWIKILNLPLNWSNYNRIDANFKSQEETINLILSTFKFLD